MAASPGLIRDWKTHGISAGLPSIRRMPMWFMLEHSGMYTVRMNSAGFTNPKTGASTGRRCWIRGRKSASPISRCVPATRNCCLPEPGTRGDRPGGGLFRSSDGGKTWTRLSGHGLPEGDWGRVGVDVAADGKRVYALIQAKKPGLYRSDDEGDHWVLANDDPRL